jgi:hypothetical protein
MPAEKVTARCIGLFNSYSGLGGDTGTHPRDVREAAPDCSIPWGFFDGASSSDQTKCGGGGCLHLTPSHYFTLKAGLGRGTNNYSELLALKLLCYLL